MLLDGKVAVVTGSGSGLGRAYAMALAKAGAKVVIDDTMADRVASVVEEIRKDGGIAEGCVVSVATMEGGRRIVETAVEKFGRIDIVVNNAGISRPMALENYTEKNFDDIIAVHLKGTFACTRHAVPYMIKQKWGRVINVASGSILGRFGQTSYAASKAGIVAMTLTWAEELAEYGITCNVIMTGAHTGMTEAIIEQARQRALEQHEKPPTASDLGYHEPETAAPLVVFLASKQAHWISGQLIRIDGPRLALWAHTHASRTVFIPEGWTVELLLKYFKTTVGTQLETYGWPSAMRALDKGLRKE